MDKNQIYDDALNLWGQTAQMEMLQEESIELALAARKHVRNCDEESFSKLAEEIADVQIMIEQTLRIYPEINEKVEKEKLYKLFRLQDRVNNKKFNG